jgi:hypothetical protein
MGNLLFASNRVLRNLTMAEIEVVPLTPNERTAEKR